MIISHDLNGNGYLINNEIWINISADAPVIYFKLILTNLSNAKVSTQFVSYADDNNSVSVNLQSVIKSLFDVPNGLGNNSARIQISITSDDGTALTLTKSFIRGGNRTNDTNQTISPNQSLRLSPNLPVWSGYPASDFFMNPDYTITEKSLAQITDIDYRRIKGNNNIYLKFLNQKGGYSYWLFESYSEKETNTPLGYLVNASNNLLDLGNESKSDLQVYSKIPKEYRNFAKDFIATSDVYAYQNAKWKKIFLKSNNIEFDNIKKVYTVNFNIDLNYRFNPSLLWSN